MNKNEYNGWYNYETWLFNLWHDSGWEDETAQAIEQALEDPSGTSTVREKAALILSDTMKAYAEDNIPPEVNTASFYADAINAAISEINFYEVAEHYINDVKLYCAVYNMPGCLPEMEPATFIEEDDAWAFLADELRSHADGNEDITDEQIEELTDALDRHESVEYDGYIYSVMEV